MTRVRTLLQRSLPWVLLPLLAACQNEQVSEFQPVGRQAAHTCSKMPLGRGQCQAATCSRPLSQAFGWLPW